MDTDASIRAVLDALGEPAVISDASGRVRLSNTSSSEYFGRELRYLQEICENPSAAEDLLAYLRRCSGSGRPLPGAATLRLAGGIPVRFRLSCSVLKVAQTSGRLLLVRFVQGGDERFATLSAKIRELNQEIRNRRHAQMRLETALEERDLLLRELHHRVKNNIHVLTGILGAAQREAGTRNAGKVLEDVTQRLQAVAAVHQILHLEGSFASVRSTDFITKVAELVMQAAGQTHCLVLDVKDVSLSNEVAVPLALILNELLTNVVKHASRADGFFVQVQIRLQETETRKIELAVMDNGPGFKSDEIPLRRGSGLGLVHGLARQIDGTFAIQQQTNGGTKCILQFRDRKLL